jgi:hypothetical protein
MGGAVDEAKVREYAERHGESVDRGGTPMIVDAGPVE